MNILGIYRLFYLAGAVNALFFSVLIFSKKVRTSADKILAAWLVILSGQLIIPFLYLSDFQSYYRYAGYEIVFFVVHQVLLNYYVKSMIGKLPAARNILLVAVVILLLEIYILSFFHFSAEERYSFITVKKMLPAIYIPFFVFVILYYTYFCVNSYKTLKSYRISVLQVFSYQEKVDLIWLTRLIILFAFIMALVLPMSIVSYFYLRSIVFADFFFYFSLVFFIFFLGYWGYQQGEVFKFDRINSTPNEKLVDKTPLPAGLVQQLYRQKASELKQVMETSKPYLNPRLAIHDLASGINIPPYQLSKIINLEFHSNFFEFVNSYRIEEFKERISSGEHRNLTILAIAFECGFNSKSAFNRIFKESTGITPGDFIKHHKT